jgi:hypothetical protein
MSDLLDPSSEFHHCCGLAVGTKYPPDERQRSVARANLQAMPIRSVPLARARHRIRLACHRQRYRRLKPGGQLFVQEPDFYPTWIWAATHQIDCYVGAQNSAWLSEGLLNIKSEGHAILYNGGSQFAEWWNYGIHEIAE